MFPMECIKESVVLYPTIHDQRISEYAMNLHESLWVLGDAKENWFVGRQFKPHPGGEFNSSDTGVIDHTAMEDVMIACCLEKLHDIAYNDTHDDEYHEYFHPFELGHHYTWAPPKQGKPVDWHEQSNEE
eukprot:6480411-Ditylum_brightwellii.AAC.1